MTVRKKVENTARKTTRKTDRKIPDNARLLKIGKNLASSAAEHLAEALERAGAKASTFLLPNDERRERWLPMGRHDVCVPFALADAIAATLLALPRKKRGRRNQWPSHIEGMATRGLLNDKPIRALAREISEVTGQSEPSTRRRLQEKNAGSELKELRAALSKVKERLGALREARATAMKGRVKERPGAK